eukprot:1865941-Prymnesium_polylepis.2
MGIPTSSLAHVSRGGSRTLRSAWPLGQAIFGATLGALRGAGLPEFCCAAVGLAARGRRCRPPLPSTAGGASGDASGVRGAPPSLSVARASRRRARCGFEALQIRATMRIASAVRSEPRTPASFASAMAEPICARMCRLYAVGARPCLFGFRGGPWCERPSFCFASGSLLAGGTMTWRGVAPQPSHCTVVMPAGKRTPNSLQQHGQLITSEKSSVPSSRNTTC